jgi:hypothetical protein
VSHRTSTELDARVGEMFQEVLHRTHLSAPADLACVIAEEARRIGVASLVVYVVDYEQRTLVPVPSPAQFGFASSRRRLSGTRARRSRRRIAPGGRSTLLPPSSPDDALNDPWSSIVASRCPSSGSGR